MPEEGSVQAQQQLQTVDISLSGDAISLLVLILTILLTGLGVSGFIRHFIKDTTTSLKESIGRIEKQTEDLNKKVFDLNGEVQRIRGNLEPRFEDISRSPLAPPGTRRTRVSTPRA